MKLKEFLVYRGCEKRRKKQEKVIIYIVNMIPPTDQLLYLAFIQLICQQLLQTADLPSCFL